MNLFISYRSEDKEKGNKFFSELLNVSENAIVIYRETEHSLIWKENVKEKIEKSDFVILLIGKNTHKSENIKWELDLAIELKKHIIAIRLIEKNDLEVKEYENIRVFDDVIQAFKYLDKIYLNKMNLKIEQYKMMVNSTQKVTDSRMKVNNLFFTITSSILSIAFLLGKTYEFSLFSIFGMLFLSLLALVITFSWSNLINSYGKLNSGKFKVIDKIEKDLMTNMFEEEWKILKSDEIKYKPNTKTEIGVVKTFQIFIIVTILLEIYYCYIY